MGNSCVEEVKCFNVIVWGIAGREVKCVNIIVWGIVVSKVEKSNVLMLL